MNYWKSPDNAFRKLPLVDAQMKIPVGAGLGPGGVPTMNDNAAGLNATKREIFRLGISP